MYAFITGTKPQESFTSFFQTKYIICVTLQTTRPTLQTTCPTQNNLMKKIRPNVRLTTNVSQRNENFIEEKRLAKNFGLDQLTSEYKI